MERIMENCKSVPVIGERRQRLWNRTAILWLIAYYAINILAFSSAIFVILLECFIDENKAMIILLSALSSILTFVGCTINFKNQFPRYRKAFNILNEAMLEYYAHPDDMTKIDNIVKAISKGENIIDSSYDVEQVCESFKRKCCRWETIDSEREDRQINTEED